MYANKFTLYFNVNLKNLALKPLMGEIIKIRKCKKICIIYLTKDPHPYLSILPGR